MKSDVIHAPESGLVVLHLSHQQHDALFHRLPQGQLRSIDEPQAFLSRPDLNAPPSHADREMEMEEKVVE